MNVTAIRRRIEAVEHINEFLPVLDEDRLRGIADNTEILPAVRRAAFHEIYKRWSCGTPWRLLVGPTSEEQDWLVLSFDDEGDVVYRYREELMQDAQRAAYTQLVERFWADRLKCDLEFDL